LAYLLLLLLTGGGAFFYITIHEPMAKEYGRMKIGMPEFDKATAELKRYKEREAWTQDAVSTLQAGLQKEITEGKAEVAAAFGGAVVVNIAESVLYTPESVTFAKDSRQTIENLASVLKNLKGLKDKEISIGNITEPTKAQRAGGKKIPARSGRDIASDRSNALVKALEKQGVPEESLIASAYAPKQSDRGFRIKDKKTIIVIATPFSPQSTAPAAAAAKPAAAPPPAQPQPIPIQPAPPKRP
jgi:hypothetical protein